MNVPDRRDLLTDSDELASRLGERQLRIVDCRFDLMAPAAGRQAYLEGHIPGAVYADLDKDLSGPVGPETGRHPLPAVDSAQATFSRLGIDDDVDVVCYDAAGGAIASRAWWLLRWWFRRPWYRQRIAMPASLLIALTGAWWAFQRVFLV